MTAVREVMERAGLCVESPALAGIVQQCSGPPSRGPGAYEIARDLVGAFEATLDADTVKKRGAVYTPTYITRRLVEEGAALLAELPDAPKIPRICDPACGAGAFLVTAVEFLERRWDVDPLLAVQEYVRGVDIDPRAAQSARATLEVLLSRKGYEPEIARSAAGRAVVDADALATPLTCLRKMLFEDGRGPDLVVTNPPYVKLQNLTEQRRKALEEQYSGLTKGSFSLALLFLVRCSRLVSSGVAGLITQNNLFTSMAGQPVRSWLQERRAVLRIVDFTHRRVFPGASAYTCLTYVGGDGSRTELDYGAVRTTDIEQGLGEVSLSPVRYAELNPAKWRLGARRDLDNVSRIESMPLHIADLCEIRVGFATLKDKAFFLDPGCVGRRPGGDRGEVEVGLTRPALKVADLGSAGDVEKKTRRVLFPYRKVEGQWTLLDWDELRGRYPGAADHLRAWKSELLARDKGKIAGDRWYGWGRMQSMDAPGPKLLTKTFDRRPNFVLDPTDSLFCNGYSVRLRADTSNGLGLGGLRRLLQSRLMHYYACVTSFHIDGGYQCYQKNFIERFGVPKLTGSFVEALERSPDSEIDAIIADEYGLDLQQIDRLIALYSGS